MSGDFSFFAVLISLTFTERLGTLGHGGSWLAWSFFWGVAAWMGLCRVCAGSVRVRSCHTCLSLGSDPDGEAAVVPPAADALGGVVGQSQACFGVEPHVMDHAVVLDVPPCAREDRRGEPGCAGGSLLCPSLPSARWAPGRDGGAGGVLPPLGLAGVWWVSPGPSQALAPPVVVPHVLCLFNHLVFPF